MASINNLKVGQTVFSVRDSGKSVFHVYITAIDLEKRKVLASFNGNPEGWYAERHVQRWRVNKPTRRPW